MEAQTKEKVSARSKIKTPLNYPWWAEQRGRNREEAVWNWV
jgi:hypothetical protein